MSANATVPILLVGNFLSDGGTGGSRSICEELAARLSQADCSVVTTSAKQGRLPRLLDMVGTTWRQRNRYAVAQVDVFSGTAFFWAEAVCAALTLARKPYILTLHGGDLPRFASRTPARVRRLIRSAAVVTTPSRYLLEHFSRYRADVRLIPNGLDLHAYAPRAAARIGPRLVWLRAFHHRYNPSLAVRMLPPLVARFPDAHLTMIGPDKGDGSRQACVELASTLGVGDHVDFCDGVPKRDVPRRLAGADIFLNTTTVDNAPVSVIEAMACGLCVVTTNVGGIPYLVEHERDALLVPSDDPIAMADAVVRILVDPELAGRLSRQGRQTAERFDWSPIIGEWRQLLAATAKPAA